RASGCVARSRLTTPRSNKCRRNLTRFSPELRASARSLGESAATTFGDEERRLSQGTALPEQQRVAGRGRVAGYPSPPFLAASVRGGMVTRWLARLSSNITPATLFRVVAGV